MTDPRQMDHLVELLRQEIFRPIGAPLALEFRRGALPRPLGSLPGGAWTPVTQETIWGEPGGRFLFRARLEVPPQAAGRRLGLRIGAQFGRVMGRSDPQLLILVDGAPFTGGDFNHTEFLLTEAAEPGRAYDILVEAGTIEDRRQLGFSLQPVIHDLLAEETCFDLKSPLDVARHLPPEDARRTRIHQIASRALKAIDLRPGTPARRAASLEAARKIAAEIYAVDPHAPEVVATGHTHIDVAWLWRVAETRTKMERSIATALRLMAEFPDYKFMYNQGYLLDALSQDAPQLFDGLKAAQARGQFEIEGALWLEPDANLIGGEALIRQIQRGVAYHQQNFGVRPRILWLPDTFGYSAALPQIMAQSGVEVFVTHKLSWNDTNAMPDETFFWQGLDGTQVPAYFLTTQPADAKVINTTYCPDLRPSHVMGTWRRYSQKGTGDKLFMVYGHGDGGGGPTREMLHHLRRMERGIPGCPRVTHGTMGGFFTDLVERMNAAPQDWPTWTGELYLEFHRGTYTSVAEIKLANRRAEASLRRLEFMAVMAGHWPEEIAQMWDILLLAQFHDILPGSSIGAVYADSRADFARFAALEAAALATLTERLTQGETPSLLVANPMGQPDTAPLRLAGDQPMAINTPSQLCHRADGSAMTLLPAPSRPALSVTTLTPKPAPHATGGLHVTPETLSNPHLTARFDQGRLVSLYSHRLGREMLSAPANRLQAFRDLPREFDAWEIDADYEDQAWEIEAPEVTVAETGPHRAALRMVWRYEASTITQVVSLEADGDVLEFDTFIDWQDRNTLLKAAFPLAIQATESIAEIQFGHVRRPSHRNTSWERARFESHMHRFVAMAEPGAGLAILNDGKYGHDAEGCTLRLTLLRAPTWPWDGADIGEHRFRYGLFPFADLAEVPPKAEAFDAPALVLPARGEVAMTLATPSHDGIGIAAVTRGGEGITLRLYERQGRAQDWTLDTKAEAALTDLMGETLTALLEGPVRLHFRPFEIKTLVLK
ncbi:alpha-mannosidase [Stagnihabitans tardus]|uniref:Alpha-mannosidase n=1 Tax=Stagnihabitans tardus TaxID=2699202 RepID=A0AAE4Y625_9RHOB|nr:alpha-mannosidase [Stagnihabitans tardus]NBZ86472.1 alpha-mannosidase [Stagnihabitans tardus]